MCRVPAQGKSLALLSSVPCFLHVNPPPFERLFVGNIDHFINKMRHLGPEGCARLIDVFQGKAADKVFREGCWFSGLFLPTGVDPQPHAVTAAPWRPSNALLGWGRSVSSPQNPCNLGCLEEQRSPPHTHRTSSDLLPQPPRRLRGQERCGRCRPWGNFIVPPPFFFSLMLVSTVPREKGQCLPAPK